MKKLLVALIVIAGAGALAWQLLWNTPERRACTKLGALCGSAVADGERCASLLADVRKSASPEDYARGLSCMADSTSCPAAIGCGAGLGVSLGASVVKDLVDGLGKSLGR